MSETVGQLQRQFTAMVGKLIDWAYANGFELTFGEAYRTPAQAELNAKSGAGIADSLHCERLAIDLNVFKDGVFLTGVEAYEPLGVYWESLGGSWGGRFTRPDADHFSLAYGGRK